jgi:hypothetical protein
MPPPKEPGHAKLRQHGRDIPSAGNVDLAAWTGLFSPSPGRNSSPAEVKEMR